ncbi:Spx/MgsR family RNA polymerase-binding regulatory protein [Caldalkalibacillus mannanilyticus]|uniref:Spx/MgsR family RNA polymerase-binding regulatory protein n=1 Tax=Caldalkalibacillus mannanilyticus TaxID=1418 RepID=UPI00046A2F82|nr:Spx/MgsR family RNA polymerase-binding regulatory protein [Caldalkalibacillus mannanilyticus]
MIKLYSFSSCTSCRKAREILMDHQIPFKEKNMSIEPLTEEEILRLLSYTTNGTTDIMSKRSQDVKDLDIDMDELSLHSWIELVNQNPGILRRPLLLTPDQLIVGYNKEEYSGLIKKAKIKNKSLVRKSS